MAIISSIASAVGAALSSAAAAIAGGIGSAFAAIGSAGAAIGSAGAAIGSAGGAIGITAEGISIASGLIGAAGSIGSGVAQAKQQRDTGKYNSAIQNNQAIEIENANQRKLAQSRMLQSQQLSNQRAIAAAKGISLESASSLSLFDDTAVAGAFREEQFNYNSSSKASSLRSGAVLSKYQGNASSTNSLVSAFGSGIASGGRVAKNWYQMG